MKITVMFVGILCLLYIFTLQNATLTAQKSATLEITTNSETLLQNWRPTATNPDYLTFDISVTVPADFSGGTLYAELQNVTNYDGICGNKANSAQLDM